MSQSIGDLELRLLFDVAAAESGAKNITATLKNTDEVINKVKKSTSSFSDSTVKLGFVLNAVKETSYILNTALSTVFSTIRSSNDAYQKFLASSRQLEATSKITGQSLEFLKETSAQTKSEFSLSSVEANKFTIEISKLTQKAGDISKTSDAIKSLLNLGAAQGLDTETTLNSIKQALLGIDDGTDKLFQKNPSVLYEEFASKIGTTAGKLNDQQKAQALLTSLTEAGGKVQGTYNQYLESAAGKQAVLNVKFEEAKRTLGEQLQPVILSLISVVNDLFESFNKLSKGWQTATIAIGIFTAAIIKLIPLVLSLSNSFPALGTAAASAGTKIAGIFGTGGPVVIAILIAIWWVNELINKIGEADREAQRLENYRKRLREESFVPIYSDTNPGQGVIDNFKKQLEKDPDKIITKDGKDIALKDYVKTLEEAQTKSTQFGKTWEEMTGQVNNGIKDQKKSLKEVQDQLQAVNEQLSNMKIDDPSLNTVKAQRDALEKERKSINDLINPESPGGSNKTEKPKDKEQLSRYSELEKQLVEIGNKINLNQGYEGAVNDLLEERKKLINEMYYVETGFDLDKVIQESNEVINNQINAQVELNNLKKEHYQADLDAQLKAFEDIHGLEVELMENEHARKIAMIEIERDKALDEINLRSISEEQKDTLRRLTNEKFNKGSHEVKRTYDNIVSDLNSASYLISIISGKFNSSGKSFLSYLQAGLQVAIQIANAINTKGQEGGGFNFGAILGIIGTVLPFLGFASGGHVPGSGSGDTVPAMLTPGEYVINKSRASQLGTQFLNWLNGGGSVQSVAPGAFASTGSGVQIVQVPYIMSTKLVKGKEIKVILSNAEKTYNRRNV
jgi:hypothetical protein